MNLIEKVKAAIEREGLIPDGIGVIVGVSGGADSVALLHILHRLGYDVTVAHLNHSIRGVEADADEQFVKELCSKLGIECVTEKTDVPAFAREKGVSLEMAAREARHEFFRYTVQSLKSTAGIALAHHADDQMETFFLRAARGTGPAGLGGMKSVQCVNELQIVRPMLGIRRAEILGWLKEENLEWREDASNLDESIPRNFVRHRLLPNLGQLNERAAENILRTMEILRADEETQLTRTAARDQLIEFGISPTFDSVERVIEFSRRTAGTTFLDLEGVRLVNEYGEVNVDAVSSPRQQCAENAVGTPRLHSIRMEEGAGILRGKWEASVSLEKIAGREVTVRTPRAGDRMNPYGMDGSKKLQDIFTDLKIPKAQRAEWPIVTCGGDIIWLPGYRIARGWDLSSETEPALHLFAETRL